MSTTSHTLHRELPHADDELMTIKGGGHTRPGPGSDTALLAPLPHRPHGFRIAGSAP